MERFVLLVISMMTTAVIFIFTMRKKLPVFIMCSDEGRETIVNN